MRKKSWLINLFILLVLYLVNLTIPPYAKAVTQRNCVKIKSKNIFVDLKSATQTFDCMDKQLKDGQGYKDHNNDTGTLAWAESYLITAYLKMYEATNDKYYLDKFIDHADSILKQRDSVRGVKDYLGESKPVWSSTKYSRGVRFAYPVHTGMIATPYAQYYNLAKNITGYYGKKANEYLEIAKQAAQSHDNEWINGFLRKPGPSSGGPAG